MGCTIKHPGNLQTGNTVKINIDYLSDDKVLEASGREPAHPGARPETHLRIREDKRAKLTVGA